MKAKKMLLLALCIILSVTGCMVRKSDLSDTGSRGPAPDNGNHQQALPPDISGLEALKGDLAGPAEERIYRLFTAFRMEEERYMGAILDSLPGIDWSTYSKQYGTIEGHVGGAMELLEWLSRNPGTWEGDNMLKVFQATNGLDGALAEQYSVIVGHFFRYDEEKFVQLLSRLDKQDIERVCNFVVYNCSYLNLQQIKESTINRFKDKDLSDKEKLVVDTLIAAFDKLIMDLTPPSG